MTFADRRAALQKRLTDFQGQKAHLESLLDQTSTAIERTVGQIQLLDELEKENSHDAEATTQDATDDA